MELSKEQVAIMHHTACRAVAGLYCGDSPDMQKLVEAGLMECAGQKSFVPDPYFRLTGKGREALSNNESNAVVGLRVLWRKLDLGTIIAVELRMSGGPIVSIQLDDGSEIHGIVQGEWDVADQKQDVALTTKNKQGKHKASCSECSDTGVVETKPGARYLYKDCPKKCLAWRQLGRKEKKMNQLDFERRNKGACKLRLDRLSAGGKRTAVAGTLDRSCSEEDCP